jgi:hypothetical protein
MNRKLIVASITVAFLFMFIGSAIGAPSLNGASPANGAEDIERHPDLTANVAGTGETTVYFMLNDGGTWSEIDSKTVTDPSETEVTTTDVAFADEYETTYTWTINISDETGWENSTEMTFTTVTPTGETINILNVMIPVIFTMAFLSLIFAAIGKLKLK